MTFQIWGSFKKDDPDSPTTCHCQRKDQLMGDGQTRMLDFERQFASDEGEELRLLYEFDPIDMLAKREVHEHMPSQEMESAMAFMVFDAYMAGWWKDTP